QPPLRPRGERRGRGDEREPRRARERHEALDHPLLLTLEMALDLHIAIRLTEDRDESLQDAARARHIAGVEPQRERPTRAAGETHEAGAVRGELVERHRRRALGGAELHPRDQVAAVLGALPFLTEQRKPRAVGEGDDADNYRT